MISRLLDISKLAPKAIEETRDMDMNCHEVDTQASRLLGLLRDLNGADGSVTVTLKSGERCVFEDALLPSRMGVPLDNLAVLAATMYSSCSRWFSSPRSTLPFNYTDVLPQVQY